MTRPSSPLRTAARWAGRVGFALVALLLVAAGTVYAVSERKLGTKTPVAAHALTVAADPATVARGRHLAMTRGCTDCHGANLRGNTIIDDPAVGLVSGPNLTAGGRGPQLSDADWELAVRHGVRRDGTQLVVMPSNEFTVMTDEDLSAIVAYARSLPADAHATPAIKVGPVIRTMFAAGQVNILPAGEIEHAKSHLASIAVDTSVTYGKYVATGCQGCHNPSYSGGKIPGTPPDWKPAANITPAGIGHYTKAAFFTAMREGKRPDGSAIAPPMPIAMTKLMTDTELTALYAYLRTVPSKPYAVR
ncbi:cytochrome c [Roseisolibacter sp. H3M3-2]|uniref:c-type cytochrome n=1 Tax=Roseisolibacter sp. H3M3-2 TaxID=3031323 RepID=UPI0023DAFE97|nr:cytochrome c [Roseisolibacter sp. H3M3-2]MDF1505924.1 cytochrome c [Roseisolibacter sp. H3M3-2]